MRKTLKKIDSYLLPAGGSFHYGPYIWLVYLAMFFTGLVAYHPVSNSYLYATVGTLLFLVVYFNAFWVSARKIRWHIFLILVIGSTMTHLTPTASVFFVYAAAFCCQLGSTKKAFTGLVVIASWIGLLSLSFGLSPFFYVPALLFSFMVGGINIYQHDISIKRTELILSQQEVRNLARTSERERIARDLHDLIGHTFSVITLKAELAGKLFDKDIDRARAEILELENISRDALKQIREVVTGYRTSDLNTELAHAKYVLESNEINFEYQFDDIQINDTVNKELAIILKELVTNVLKHAEASKVRAEIKAEESGLVMRVSDNGSGFSKEKVNGFGLKGISERVDKLSGQVEIESNSASGSNFTIIVPAEKHQ